MTQQEKNTTRLCYCVIKNAQIKIESESKHVLRDLLYNLPSCQVFISQGRLFYGEQTVILLLRHGKSSFPLFNASSFRNYLILYMSILNRLTSYIYSIVKKTNKHQSYNLSTLQTTVILLLLPTISFWPARERIYRQKTN